jgi:hypothetical protein
MRILCPPVPGDGDGSVIYCARMREVVERWLAVD